MPGLDPEIVQYKTSKVPFRCGTCAFFVKEGRPCQVVNYNIKATGFCNFWTREEQFYSGPLITPQAAGYIEGGVDNHNCNSCRYIEKNKFCPVINKFVSEDEGSCNVFSPQKKNNLLKSIDNFLTKVKYNE